MRDTTVHAFDNFFFAVPLSLSLSHCLTVSLLFLFMRHNIVYHVCCTMTEKIIWIAVRQVHNTQITFIWPTNQQQQQKKLVMPKCVYNTKMLVCGVFLKKNDGLKIEQYNSLRVKCVV